MSKANNSPSLPPGWVLADLSAIAQINPPLDRCIINEAVPVNFIPMKAVEPEGGGLARPEICTYGEVKKGYTPFLSGDVIMAKITPCMENGKTTVVPDLPDSVCFGSTEFHVFRPEQGINPHWLNYYLLQSNFRKLAGRNMAGSAGQLRVPAPFLYNVKIPLAPPPEQQRILEKVEELLTYLDAGVEALQRVQKKLNHYRAAILKAAVEGSLTRLWRQQHIYTETAPKLLTRILDERRITWEKEQLRKFAEAKKEPPKKWKAKYKQPKKPSLSNIWAIPSTWTWTGFEELSAGLAHSLKAGPFGSALKKEFYTQTGYKIYGQEQVIRADPYYGDYFISEKHFKQLQSCAVKPGDVLISLVGTTGKILILPKDIQPGIINPRLLKVSLSPGNVEPQFIKIVLESPYARQFFKGQSHGGTMEILNLTILKQFPIPLPPLTEQQAIVDEVDDQLSIIEHLEAEVVTNLKAAQALRQAILRDAFTGQLVPQDPNDEPALELLKHIANEREEREQQINFAKRSSVKSKQPRKRSAAI
jgi:type I restriction enzyme S subunit